MVLGAMGMVHGKYAGVMFSVNPVTGADEIVVEAAREVDGVTSGGAVAVRHCLDKSATTHQRQGPQLEGPERHMKAEFRRIVILLISTT